MEKQEKRERSVNFSQEETDLLVSLAEGKKNIIESKKSDAATWRVKEKAWKDIEKAFNSSSSSVYRDHRHLKLKYEAIKRDTRKKYAIMRAERYKSGSHTSTSPVLTPAEQKVKDMILVPVEGNDYFDSDLVLQNVSDTTRPKKLNVPNEEWNPTAQKSKNYPVLGKAKQKRPYDKLPEEKIEIAKIQKNILTEELGQKLIQRKILEKELEYKDELHQLETQHLLLKIELLKKQLEKIEKL